MAKLAPPPISTLPNNELMDASMRDAIDLSNQWLSLFMSNQSAPLQWFIDSQSAWTVLQQEMWEEWCARFAGGVPIDG